MTRSMMMTAMAITTLAGNMNCDVDRTFVENEALQDADGEVADELAPDPAEGAQRPDETIDGSVELSADEQEVLWLTRSLYRRHLAGYPGGLSAFESRFERALAEFGGVSDEYLMDYCKSVEHMLASKFPEDHRVGSVDDERLADLLRLSPVSEAGSSQDVSELAAPVAPALAPSYRYRFKTESIKMQFCSSDAGELPCAIEEPFVAWCFFWPSGSACGVTNQTTIGNGMEQALRGPNLATTGYNPTAVMAFYQIIDVDGVFNAQKYSDALTTTQALITAQAINWGMTSVPPTYVAFWNQSINAIKGQDDPYQVIADVYRLDNLQSRVSASLKPLSDCLLINKATACSGNYLMQSMVVKDVAGSWPWRTAMSITAQP